ncbi:MAG: hypothetical protein ABW046_07110 [Actinoplanes sp.]
MSAADIVTAVVVLILATGLAVTSGLRRQRDRYRNAWADEREKHRNTLLRLADEQAKHSNAVLLLAKAHNDLKFAEVVAGLRQNGGDRG